MKEKGDMETRVLSKNGETWAHLNFSGKQPVEERLTMKKRESGVRGRQREKRQMDEVGTGYYCKIGA